MEGSPAISSSELVEIDSNALLVAHQGRQPGLILSHVGEKVTLADWGESLFEKIKQCSKLLSDKHQESVESISIRIKDPDLTPSAIMLNEMKRQEKGFFEFTDQYSQKYKTQNQEKAFDKDYFLILDELAISSTQAQLEAESNDAEDFDQFLEKYFEDDA